MNCGQSLRIHVFCAHWPHCQKPGRMVHVIHVHLIFSDILSHYVHLRLLYRMDVEWIIGGLPARLLHQVAHREGPGPLWVPEIAASGPRFGDEDRRGSLLGSEAAWLRFRSGSRWNWESLWISWRTYSNSVTYCNLLWIETKDLNPRFSLGLNMDPVILRWVGFLSSTLTINQCLGSHRWCNKGDEKSAT